jgi:glyoxylase-like metal-dependent hydrolase (beta-lactamase superfamily II)
MWKILMLVMAVLALMVRVGESQEAKTVLDGVAKTMGATDLKSIQYSGSGSIFAVGQNFNPSAPWPKFNVKSFTRAINYETGSLRDEIVRTQAEHPPRGGGGQPVVGEQRQVLLVSGTHAWNQPGDTAIPAPVTLVDRLLQVWITPHGVVKAALAHNATVQSRTEGDKKMTTIAFMEPGKFKVTASINDQNLVDKVESWVTNPVLGDMLVETTYSDYRGFDGVKFPTKILQKQGGFPTLDLTVNAVQPNAAVDIQVPDNVRQAAVRVDAQKVADGVWYLAGGTHHSVLVEMKEYVVVVEGPQNDERATAVIAEVKRTVPTKPIKYVVNSHHHFDHAGGLGPFVAEGATIVTHAINKPFFERALAAPRTVSPDKLAQSGKKATIDTLNDKLVWRDETRTVELHLIQDNTHCEGLIMAYLPQEKLLIEADAYSPAPPNTPPPAQANPFSVNLVENIERLKLAVDQILPLHGRVVPLAELLKAIGKTS